MGRIISHRQLNYFREKIQRDLAEIRGDIGEVRYKSYISMANECNDYEQLKEMADLGLQIQMVYYIRTSIRERLQQLGISLEDLIEVYGGDSKDLKLSNEVEEMVTSVDVVNSIDIEDDTTEYVDEGIDYDTDNPEILSAMALMVSKRIAEAYLDSKDGDEIGLSDDEELELLMKEALDEEAKVREEYGEVEGEGVVDENEEGLNEQDEFIEDYFVDTDDDTSITDNDEEINIEMDDNYFIEEDGNSSLENEEEFGDKEGINIDENDYFLHSSDDDTLDEENFEDEKVDIDDYFIDSDDSDTDERVDVDNIDDIEIDIDEEEFFIDSTENFEDTDDELSIDNLNEDDFFVDDESDAEEIDDTSDEDEFNIDDFFVDDLGSGGEDFSSDRDTTFDEADIFIDEGDDYFNSDDIGNYLSVGDRLATESRQAERYLGSSFKPIQQREVTPANVFQNKEVQDMFNIIHKTVEKADRTTRLIIDKTTDFINKYGKKIIKPNK